MERYPWHVQRLGRDVETDEEGRRYYRDDHGDPVYEWTDDDVEPANLALWDEAVTNERMIRFALRPRSLRERR